MYSSSNQSDYQKFNTTSPPPSAPPPPAFDQSGIATGIPVNSAHQFYSANAPPPPPVVHQVHLGGGGPVNSAHQFYSANAPPQPHVVHQVHFGGGQETPWSTGLFDCGSDVSNCCITCWCPCITFGLISDIVDKGTSSCVANGGIYALLAYFTGCPCIFSCIYRTKMRQQYMLKEDPCGDCILHFCCEPCALCQEYRELQNRGFIVNIGWQANMERQTQGVAMPPVVQAGMHR